MIKQHKAEATRLGEILAGENISLPHKKLLHVYAKWKGYENWQTLHGLEKGKTREGAADTKLFLVLHSHREGHTHWVIKAAHKPTITDIVKQLQITYDQSAGDENLEIVEMDEPITIPTHNKDDLEYLPRVTAEIRCGVPNSDLNKVNVTKWLVEATDAQIFHLFSKGLSNTDASDQIAIALAKTDERIKDLLVVIRADKNKTNGICLTVEIQPETAAEWVRTHRPTVWRQILAAEAQRVQRSNQQRKDSMIAYQASMALIEVLAEYAHTLPLGDNPVMSKVKTLLKTKGSIELANEMESLISIHGDKELSFLSIYSDTNALLEAMQERIDELGLPLKPDESTSSGNTLVRYWRIEPLNESPWVVIKTKNGFALASISGLSDQHATLHPLLVEMRQDCRARLEDAGITPVF